MEERSSRTIEPRFDADVHPSKLQTILPCDASQHEAILAIKSGA